MKEIVEYITVQADSPYSLQWLVRDELNEFYQPYGNPVIFGSSVFQVMVKYSTNE